jgi:hypothetical protein
VTRGDRILVLSTVLITILVWAGFTYLPPKQENPVAVVTVNGKEVLKLLVGKESLSQVTIPIPRGEATLEYGQGKIRVLPLNHHVCPNEVCWRTGWISVSGQSIVCVPNHMVITLHSSKVEIDSIVR